MKWFNEEILYFKKNELLFFVIFFFSTILYSQPLPVASYPFNGNPNDVSGNNNHGILGGETANPTPTTDRFGNLNSAYEFGGYFNKNWIQIPNNPTLHFDTAVSVSLWFKQCAFDGMNGYGGYVTHGYHMLITKAGDGCAAVPGIWSGTGTDINNVLHVNFNNKNDYSNIVNFAEDTTLHCFDNCEWVHFVVVVQNDTLKMYFNGQLRKHVAINPANFTVANTQDFWIGRMFGSSVIWYPFNGVIDDVNIYNEALTQSDVNLLYGNYYDPLADNNTIIIDSVSIEPPDCFNTHLGSIIVYPNSNNEPYEFSIDNGVTYQTSNLFTDLSAGNYTVKIKSSCNEKDTIIPMIPSSVVHINNSISICQGQDYSGYIETGIYMDTLLATNGCDTIVTLNLIVNPNPIIDVTASQDLFCEETPITLTASGATSYIWSNALEIANPIVVYPINTTTYMVTGTVEGCIGTSSITISKKCDCNLYIPNTFTPGGKLNTKFSPVSNCEVVEYSFMIFNRWGEKLFETNSLSDSWDGTYRGSISPSGIYGYIITYKFDKERPKRIAGSVNLMR